MVRRWFIKGLKYYPLLLTLYVFLEYEIYIIEISDLTNNGYWVGDKFDDNPDVFDVYYSTIMNYRKTQNVFRHST